jgi:WD40-like Beta Propeller Repeat
MMSHSTVRGVGRRIGSAGAFIGLLASVGAIAWAAAGGTALATRWTPPAVASDAYESSPAFTPNGQTMYLMRANRAFTEYTIMQSDCSPSGWTSPRQAPFALPRPVNDADPFVTRDGRRLYFVSSRPFPGKRGDDLDIWYVELDDRGRWGPAIRLPEPVNSTGAELMPRVTADGRIYFGSDRPGGLGGNDVYLAVPLAGGAWRVDNLGPPVNTRANDYEAEISVDGRQLVVVSDREGRSHLYRYVRKGDQWHDANRIPARDDVFQVGPLLSPRGDRLLFAQADGARSGEIFLADLEAAPDSSWPPAGHCTR